MNFSKTDIVKGISKKSSASIVDAKSILESFLSLIKSKSKSGSVKISSFGSFNYKITPKRLGRNPKTKDSYVIPEHSKLNFKPSSKIKENLN